MFEANEQNVQNQKKEKLFRILFGFMTATLVLPVFIILTMLIIKGGPIISLEFLFKNPTNGMTAGGILPALLGTVWLVLVALLVSVPLGVPLQHHLGPTRQKCAYSR